MKWVITKQRQVTKYRVCCECRCGMSMSYKIEKSHVHNSVVIYEISTSTCQIILSERQLRFIEVGWRRARLSNIHGINQQPAKHGQLQAPALPLRCEGLQGFQLPYCALSEPSPTLFVHESPCISNLLPT